MSSTAETRAVRSLDDFAMMVASVVRRAQVDAVLCVTESGQVFERLSQHNPPARLIAATPSEDTYHRLRRAGAETIHIPARVASRFTQARHALSVALDAKQIAPGDFVAVAIGQGLPGYGGDFLLLMDVQPEVGRVPLRELISVADHVRPDVLEAVLQVACRIGRAAKRGKPVGALFAIGDPEHLLADSRQLVPNPFRGYGAQKRNVTNPDIHETLVELAKLDGAFVVSEDGRIKTAGVYLAPGEAPAEVPHGLGTRHVAAARVTMRTRATAIVVSATDGNVRVFAGGRLVLRIDPEGPLPEDG